MYMFSLASVTIILASIISCDGIDRPNILIIIADDLGIGDVGCFGNDSIRTPHIDRLAEEGVKLTHHFSVAAVCTPSRAALLVGRYPTRFGFMGEIHGGPPVSHHVANSLYLPHSEVTLGEAFSAANYSTGFVGKWHLGANCELFGLRCPGPMEHGFSFCYALLFTLTIDMAADPRFFTFSSIVFSEVYVQGIFASLVVVIITLMFLLKKKLIVPSMILVFISIPTFFWAWFAVTHLKPHTTKWVMSSAWFNRNMNQVTIRDGIPIKQTLNFDTVSSQMVNESIGYIDRVANNEYPFLLIHSFLHVHTPMFTAKKNAGRSCCGRYGDNIEEMDDGVGSIIQALKNNKIQDSTIVYFASDHGGHLEIIDEVDGQRIGGYNKRFKGGKGMGGQEGGIRVPAIMKWPNKLTANTSMHIPTATMDIMPTLLELAGLPTVHELVPNDNVLDGKSFAYLLLEEKKSPREDRIFLHHCERHIHSIRLSTTQNKVFKIHLNRPNWSVNSTQCGWGGDICNCEEGTNLTSNPLLYELTSDPYEDSPISPATSEYKNVVPYLLNYLQEWKQNTPYGEAMFSHWKNNVWIPWRQPFCFWNW